jgi:transcriptional regulator of nitric oxide reductase
MFLGEPEAIKSQSSQVKVKAKVTANKSKSSQVKAKVTATVKIQLMSAQFSPVQSSPAHLEFNLNPCQYSSSRSQLQHFSAVGQFNAL